MKLSVWSSYYANLSPEDAIKTLADHGFRYCELSDEHSLILMNRGDPTVVGKIFGDYAKELGIQILQGHLTLKAKIGREEDVEKLLQQLDLFHSIGIRNAVLHCDSFVDTDLSLAEKRDRNEAALRRLTDHIKDTDMVICLENMRGQSITQTAEELLYFIEKLNSKNLGICLDTGHLNLGRNPDQIHFIRTAGKHIKALHIADNDGTADQHLMPFARGTVDVAAVIRELKAMDYRGLYNLEIPGESRCPMEIRSIKLDYIQKVFARLDRMC